MNDRADADDSMAGWMRDPYDESRRDPLMKNGADDRAFDAKFPDHPLSLVRAELASTEATLHL